MLALSVYRATRDFPKEELYGMTSQLREPPSPSRPISQKGSKRPTTKDLCHFLSIAQGSNDKVKCLALLARDLAYLTPRLPLMLSRSDATSLALC